MAEFLFQRCVDAGHGVNHGNRSLHRLFSVVIDVERSIPERHDAVADVLIDRALMRVHDLRQGCQNPVDDRGQGRGIILEGL